MKTYRKCSTMCKDILDDALFLVAHNAPYIYPSILAMERIAKPEVGTAGVDKHFRMYYNPTWVEEMGANSMAYVLIHEWAHCIREHGAMCIDKGYDPDLWNVACDLSINQMAFGKLTYPAGTGVSIADKQTIEVYGKMDAGLSEEEYYSLIQQAKENGGGDGDGEDGFGKGQGEGSGVTGEQAPWESEEAPRMSEIQVKSQIQKAAEAITHEAGKGKGNVPAGMELWANSLLKPQINWRKRIGSIMYGVKRVGTGRIDHSRHRKRTIDGRTMFFPRQRSIKPKVVFVVDTSGSMLDGSLDVGISEVYYALGSCEASVIWCDTDPSGPYPVKTRNDLLKQIGGGGSDMGPGIRLAEKEAPGLIITITDGYVSWPESCSVQHLGVLVEGSQPVPFGETIQIKNTTR